MIFPTASAPVVVFQIKKHELPLNRKIMNSIEKDAPSYRELLLEQAWQVKYNKPIKYKDFKLFEDTNILEDISEEVDPSQIDWQKKCFEDLSEEETEKNLGRKKFWNLALLKPFVDILKYKTHTKTTSILSLSCNSKFWKMVYKNHQNVVKLFHIAQEVQLIKCVDATYRFNTKKSNRSKMYAWNKKQEKTLLSLFKKYKITDKFVQSLLSINYSYLISIVQTFGKDEKKKQELVEANRRFNIRIAQRTCLPLSDEIIAAAINERYPQYIAMCKTIAEDNAMKPIDEMDYANLNIKRDKNHNAISISIRKTNQYCPAKVRDITDEDRISGKRAIRNDILMKKFGAVYGNDVKSSIYRITYLLNRGVWLDESIDLYERIFGDKLSSDERDLFKSPFCMMLYFNTSSKSMKAHMEYNNPKTKMWNKLNYGDTLIEKARDNMFKAIGKSWHSEIFLHESCIYTQVAHRLRLLGYKVIQIYDGFYTDRFLDKSEFRRIVKEEAMRYYKTYIAKDANTDAHININNKFNTYINSGHIRETSMKKAKKIMKQDNSDIPTEEDFKREEQKRYAKLDKKYKFSSLLDMAEHGDISSKDLNILLEAFKFKYLRAKPCKLGFTPSSTSIAFKKFVKSTLSRISAHS